MVICSSQDAPSLAHLHHRNLLNTAIPSMLQDTSKQKSNNYKLQCCDLPHEWLLVTYNNSASDVSAYCTTEQTNQCLWWRHIRTCSWNDTQNPYDMKTVKLSNWKTPKHPIQATTKLPGKNYTQPWHLQWKVEEKEERALKSGFNEKRETWWNVMRSFCKHGSVRERYNIFLEWQYILNLGVKGT